MPPVCQARRPDTVFRFVALRPLPHKAAGGVTRKEDGVNPDSIVRDIQEPELLDTLRGAWREAMQDVPARGAPPFLDPAEFRVSREWCGFGPEHDAALGAAAERIRNNPALCRLAWFYAWKIFEAPPALAFGANDRWPKLEAALGDQAGLFFLLIGLSFAPRLRRYHRLLGVPEAITRETCRQPLCFCGNYQRARGGRLGIFTRQLGWLRHYVRDNLYFRIGRFEYWARGFEDALSVFRHRRTGRVVALADDGVRFNPQGYIDEPGKGAPGTDNWTASLILDEEAITGTPVSPLGMAGRRPVRLPFADWRKVLGRGDPVLDIHIPAGGNMGLESCGESLRRARDFFSNHFPVRTPVAYVCNSWIFSPCLEECLPPDSNLVRLLRETHLFAVPSTNPDIWFVFFQDKFDPATAPRDTRLQRALLDYLAAGHAWRNGGMFFLADDLPAFGSQGYRRDLDKS